LRTKALTMHINHSPSAGLHEESRLCADSRSLPLEGRPYDPTALIALLLEQHPERPALVGAFAQCVREWPETTEELYTWFICPSEHHKRWKHAGGLFLCDPVLGELVVDLVHDTGAPGGIAIGGMEYMGRVLDPGRHVS